MSGCVWYPKNLFDCPVLFIIHGAHSAKDLSYLGYNYLGKYLSSNGYVVVSVDENIINDLETTNDARAILLLENMKEIFKINNNSESPLHKKIDKNKIALAGHSRGGESVATAYLFKDMNFYPDNGNIKFDYHFNISSLVAIAPTVDQYLPADQNIKISNVNYLLIHGSNDQDVSSVMGEKQFKNISFTDDKNFIKSSVYIMGANHGQFNEKWGRYDMIPGTNGFLNTNNFIDEQNQKLIAKIYIRTFLDKPLINKSDYSDLLIDNRKFLSHLPKTVYVTNYMDSKFKTLFSFEENLDLICNNSDEYKIDCQEMDEWKIRSDVYGLSDQNENHVLECNWKKDSSPKIKIDFPQLNFSKGGITFRIADMNEDYKNNKMPFIK